MFLENVAVTPAAAGHGIGKPLIRFCEDTARGQGLGRVRLYTNEKMAETLMIYPRLGYAEVGRRTEDGFNRVYFEKALKCPPVLPGSSRRPRPATQTSGNMRQDRKPSCLHLAQNTPAGGVQHSPYILPADVLVFTGFDTG